MFEEGMILELNESLFVFQGQNVVFDVFSISLFILTIFHLAMIKRNIIWIATVIFSDELKSDYSLTCGFQPIKQSLELMLLGFLLACLQ